MYYVNMILKVAPDNLYISCNLDIMRKCRITTTRLQISVEKVVQKSLREGEEGKEESGLSQQGCNWQILGEKCL